MTKKKWIEVIKGQLEALKLYEKAYDPAVDALAGVLVQRDKTAKEFKDSGGKSVIEYTNKSGATNITKNPLVTLWDDLNKTALAYWRELGLTPSAYKKLMGGTVKEEKRSQLLEALSSIDSD